MNIQVVGNFSEEDLILIPNNKSKYYFPCMSPKPKQYGLADTTFSNRFDTRGYFPIFGILYFDKKLVCGTLP